MQIWSDINLPHDMEQSIWLLGSKQNVILMQPLGEVISWKDRCRIKHLPTKMYLAVVHEDNSSRVLVSTLEMNYLLYSLMCVSV